MRIVGKLIKRVKQAVAAIFVLLIAVLVFFSYTVYTVYSYPRDKAVIKTDAVIVLGAAAWGGKPSPVFKERINHAIRLYDAGMCRYIIFTGGKGGEDEPGESVIARRYAIKNGVNEKFILIENKSRTTEENIFYAGKIAEKYGLKTFTLVSDPYHLNGHLLLQNFME